MASGTFTFYHQGKLNNHDGVIDVVNDTIVCVLLAAAYTPDAAAHATYADISANEIADADYAPEVVTNIASTIDGSGTVLVDSDDISFGNPVTIEAKYAAFVQRAGASLASTDRLLGYVDLNTDSGTATVQSTSSAFSVLTPNGLYSL